MPISPIIAVYRAGPDFNKCKDLCKTPSNAGVFSVSDYLEFVFSATLMEVSSDNRFI